MDKLIVILTLIAIVVLFLCAMKWIDEHAPNIVPAPEGTVQISIPNHMSTAACFVVRCVACNVNRPRQIGSL